MTAALAKLETAGRSRLRNTGILLWCVTVVLLTMTWIHVLSLVDQSLEREMTSAHNDLSNLTRLSQEHAVRTLKSADQVIRFVQNQYLEHGGKLDLTSLTRHGVIDTEIFNQVGIIDEKGIYALANRPIASKLDLSDREHFKVHLAADTDTLFVSKPVIGRATGKWSIQMTRRITRPNGEFAGVVVISIDPTYFTNFYGELNLGPEGLNAIYGLDGIARARRVGSSTDFGSDASSSSLFTKRIQTAPHGGYLQRSVVDGVERMYYFRKIEGYSLVTLAGVDVNYLLGNHRNAANALYWQAAQVSALILALAFGLSWHLWLLRREADSRRKAQAQLQDRTQQLDAVFEMSPDGFVSFDRNNRVKSVNPAFRSMTGAQGLSLEGLDEREFFAWLANLCDPASAFVGMEALRANAEKYPDAQQIIELQKQGGRILDVQLRTSDNSSVSQILYLRDITHKTEVEAMKSEFLATAAHELRTPMASIFGFSEIMLAHDSDSESRKEFLGIIHKQSKLMVQILNELLDLARIEARRGKDFQFTRLCVQELLDDLIRSYQCPTDRANPQLLSGGEPLYVMADSGKMRQALLNVISNAYKYSPNGGEVTVHVELHREPNAEPVVRIRVEDHGIGMTEEQVAKVFTRFYRADASGKVPGTGLGMSITKEIVDHHKGSISIESTLGKGTTVTMVFPFCPEPLERA